MPWHRLLAFILCALAFDAARVVGQEIEPIWMDSDDLTTETSAESEDSAEIAWKAEIASLRERIVRLEQSAAEAEADTETKPVVNWTGELQADFYAFNQDESSKQSVGDIENGEAFRRARFGMWGDYGPSEYRIEFDFAQEGRPSYLDVYGGIKDLPVLGRVRVGHFLEPFSLDRIQSNRYLTFMERGLPSQAFSPGRNMGIGANDTWAEEDGTWAIGLFRTDSDDWGDAVGDQGDSSLTGRVTCLPWYDSPCLDSQFLHIGMSGSFRVVGEDLIQFQAQPEAQLGATFPNVPFFVDTGLFPASNYTLLGLEAAYENGPFSVQGELFRVPVDTLEFGNIAFDGWYAQATYFLTGEHRPYLREHGVFTRVHPHRDFLRYAGSNCVAFGPGAWEVAVRLSHIDLNDGAIRGGKLTDFSVGLNWYLNPYLRFTSNYIHAFLDDSNGVESGTDIFACRVQYEF